MNKDNFGDRMKKYEKAYTSYIIPIETPLCVRIDGKKFSKFTKGFKKPFDFRLSSAFISTCHKLADELRPDVIYTQSDEISMVFNKTEKQLEYIFGGKISKINSVTASMATAFFNEEMRVYGTKPAFFDARCWTVPSLLEAANTVLWRIKDAEKNSVSCLFRYSLGHKAMQGLSSSEMKSLLRDSNVYWEDLYAYFKYGCLMVKNNNFIEESPRESFLSLPIQGKINYIFNP